MTVQNPRDVFLEALENRTLLLQQCRDCGQFMPEPQTLCISCGDPDLRWVEASGWGIVLSLVENVNPETGYGLFNIALDEGPQLTVQIVKPDTGNIHPGMKVFGHVDMQQGQPRLLFSVQENEEDEW